MRPHFTTTRNTSRVQRVLELDPGTFERGGGVQPRSESGGVGGRADGSVAETILERSDVHRNAAAGLRIHARVALGERAFVPHPADLQAAAAVQLPAEPRHAV